MEKNTSIAIVLSSIIIGAFLIYSASILTASIDNAGSNITNSNFYIADSINGIGTNENYELVVIDEWLYLYNSKNGHIWKRPDNNNPNEPWISIKNW